jgi:thiamine kinase-like enzyme
MDFIEVIRNFFPNKETASCVPFGNGHINSTFKLVIENDSQEYILQKINTNVFKNPQQIVQNHFKIQNHIKSGNIEIPFLIELKENQYLFIDNEQNVWRMMNFIKDSYSVEIVSDENQAYQAGKGYGWFLNACSGLKSTNFTEAIPNFHKLSFRNNQLEVAVKLDKVGRYDSVKDVVAFYKEREQSLLKIEALINRNEIPLRVVHNDTKINNLLFRNKEVVAVIDLDTVGPGSVFFDYGDALRTICNTAAEDEKDLDKVDFSQQSFEKFTEGYLNQTKSILNNKEKEFLYLAPIYMTFIIGIRFLTDFLDGDNYYKTSYSEHNLVRSLVQKKMIEQMEQNVELIKQIIANNL